MLLGLTAAALVLGAWTVWLIRRADLGSWLYAPTIFATVGIPALTALGATRLARTFDDATEIAAAERQAMLSHGISRAMIATGVAVIVLGLWLIALAVATARVKRRGRLELPRG